MISEAHAAEQAAMIIEYVRLSRPTCACQVVGEDLLIQQCRSVGRWLHPQWFGFLCDRHKETHEPFASIGWRLIDTTRNRD